MPREEIFEKTVSFTSDIMGPLIGKGRRNINRIKQDNPMVNIRIGKDGRYPCFFISSSSLSAVNKCEKDVDGAISRANASAQRRQEEKRIERQRQQARSKVEAEKRIRENIIRELKEADTSENETKTTMSHNEVSTRVKSSNPFGALLDDDSSDGEES